MPENPPLIQGSSGYVHRVGECTALREYVNEATHGPCWKCGGGEDTHRPENRPLGGIDPLVALWLGMPVQWAERSA